MQQKQHRDPLGNCRLMDILVYSFVPLHDRVERGETMCVGTVTTDSGIMLDEVQDLDTSLHWYRFSSNQEYYRIPIQSNPLQTLLDKQILSLSYSQPSIRLHIHQSPLSLKRTRIYKPLVMLLKDILNIPSALNVSTITPITFYSSLENSIDALQGESDLESINDLVPSPRPYQQSAIRWMLSRELSGDYLAIQELCRYLGWIEYQGFYVNTWNMHVVVDINYYQQRHHVYGGILADEMGLGKTIEFISLCLLNRFVDSDDDSSSGDEIQKKPMQKAPSQPLLQDNSSKYWSDLDPTNIPCTCLCSRDFLLPSDGEWIQCTSCSWRLHQHCLDPVSFSSKPFKCINCTPSSVLVKCKTTLIICPEAIIQQWMDEIHHSAPSLSIHRYKGIKHILQSAAKRKNAQVKPYEWLLPQYLTQFDIILTTFNVLRDELVHTLPGNTRSMRFTPRYHKIRSPLPLLEWFRIGIDEAQMIENSTIGDYTKMILLLESKYKWCISGTPISKGSIHDLYNLLLFLGVDLDPYNDLGKGNPLQNMKNEHVLELFRPIFWKTSKITVTDQLNIPRQNELTSIVKFTSVEQYFYKQQYRKVKLLIDRLDSDLNGQEELYHSLLVLRQACCHPQLVLNRDGHSSSSSEILSLEHILYRLLDKQRLACIELLRSIVMYRLEIAGLYRCKATWLGLSSKMLKPNELVQSVKYYEKVLTSSFEYIAQPSILTSTCKISSHSSSSTTISKNRLGSLYTVKWQENLDEEGTITIELPSYKIISGILVKDCSSSKQSPKYTLQIFNHGKGFTDLSSFEVPASERGKEYIHLLSTLNSRSNMFRLISSNPFPGSSFSFQLLEAQIVIDDLQLLHTFYNLNQVCNLLDKSTPSSYQENINMIISRYLGQYQAKHDQIIQQLVQSDYSFMDHFNQRSTKWYIHVLEESSKQSSEQAVLDYVSGNVFIHSSLQFPAFSSIPSLGFSLCQAMDRIYSLRTQIINECIKLSSKPSSEELSLNSNCYKCRRGKTGEICSNCVLLQNIERLEGLVYSSLENRGKDTHSPYYYMYKHLHRVCKDKSVEEEISLGYQLHKEIQLLHLIYSCHQNLLSSYDEIQTSTCCLVLQEAQDEGVEEQAYSVPFHEIDDRLHNALQNLKNTEWELSEQFSQLKYLNNLGETFIESNSPSQSLCSVCLESFNDEKISILECGHSFHSKCVQLMIQKRSTRVKCPICRRVSGIEDLSYSSMNISSGPSLREAGNQQGDWGSKVNTLVKDVKQLAREEKCIVFSQWDGMLDIVQASFGDNQITFVRGGPKRTWEDVLSRFQHDPNITALLLPIRKGAQGLNLTQATHIFLLEPILNVSLEAQAINRIHRIGQTHETTIHRYIVEETIEQRIHEMRMNRIEQAGGNDALLANIKTKENDELSIQDVHVLFKE